MAIGWDACSWGHICRLTPPWERTYHPYAISWDACSWGTYMSADTLGAHNIFIWPLAGTLQRGRIYVGLTRLGSAHINWPRRHKTCSRGTYMSATRFLGAQHIYMAFGWPLAAGAQYVGDTLGAHIYYMAIGWDACSWGTYMSADNLDGAHILYGFGWDTCSREAYMLGPHA